MLKKYCSQGKKITVTLIQIISFMCAVFVLCQVIASSIIFVGDEEFILNPFDTKEEFIKNQMFADMFMSDAQTAIQYLAVSRQFETNGEFDKEKTVDLLEYYYRKSPNSSQYTTNRRLCYRVQDLINWQESYGFSYTEDTEPGYGEKGKLIEYYLPVDGISIYEKDIMFLLDEANLAINEDSSIYDYETSYIENSSTTSTTTVVDEAFDNVEADEVENVAAEEQAIRELVKNMDYNDSIFLVLDSNDNFVTIDHNIMWLKVNQDVSQEIGEINFVEDDADGDSMQKLKDQMIDERMVEARVYSDFLYESLQQAEAYERLYEILVSVASDLSYNYVSYQQKKEAFVDENTNFKFLYIPEVQFSGRRNYYTNLEIDSLYQAKEAAKEFSDQFPAYLVVDAVNGNVVEKSGDFNTTSFLNSLTQMKYVFQDGGNVYLAVMEPNNESEYFVYSNKDKYAEVGRTYNNVRASMEPYMIMFSMCVLICLICVIIITAMCGRKLVKRLEDGKEVYLVEEPKIYKGDKIFTEILLALFFGTIIGILILANFFIGGLETYTVKVFLENHLITGVVVIGFGLINGILLMIYCSFIRRIKARTFWKGSLLYNVLYFIGAVAQKIGKCFVLLYRESGAAVKALAVIIPVACLCILHIILGMAYHNLSLSGIGIFFLLIVDLAIGGYIFYNTFIKTRIVNGVKRISDGEINYKIDLANVLGGNKELAEAVNHIGDGIRDAVETSMKDERMKADLITNVSHDIKTPLTSIINYVDLLKRENVQDQTIRGYIQVLDEKSQRLKQLTEDLVEASKISSGNITLHFEDIDVVELMNQAIGEYSDQFENKNLSVVEKFPEYPCVVKADSRYMWRVVDNLFGNINKYAMEGTRVYLEIKALDEQENGNIKISIKNISTQALNIKAAELTERFIRGDLSRSTEGSGLGLSIAKSLVEAMNGRFDIYLDGDLFKVTITI